MNPTITVSPSGDTGGLLDFQPGTKAVFGMAVMGGLIGGLYGVLTGSRYQILPVKAPIFGAAIGAAFQVYKQGGINPPATSK
jgi:uncharacterized membrane protein